MATTLGGFRPVKTITGAAWNGQVTRYFVPASDSTAIYIYDPVKLAGTTDGLGVRGVTKAAAGDALVGVVVGIAPVGPWVQTSQPQLDLPQYRRASVGTYVYVVDDPAVVFETSCPSGIAEADVGLNANFTASTGSTTTGISNAVIDGATEATGATLPFKLLEVVQTPDVSPSATALRLLVKINNHQLASGTGTAGVA